MTHIEIPGDFTGPARSAQGGIAAGLLAGHLDGSAEVRLHAPPPLATSLRVDETDGGLEAWLDDTLVLSARSKSLDVSIPDVDLDAAARAGVTPERQIAPHCIVCGDRHARGLGVFPGPVDGSTVIGTKWTPPAWTAGASGSVSDELVWGVLDCPGSWSHLAGGGFPAGSFPALGSIAVELLEPIPVNDPVVVLGWPLEVDGRKYRAATAIVGPAGTALAVSNQTCIALPLAWAA